jgi:hypothetical protein
LGLVLAGYKEGKSSNDMVETKSHFRLDYTSISCIYKVFKHLWRVWVTTGYKSYHYDMVEAKSHLRLDCTFV